MSAPNDTTTTLNQAVTTGDKMDESAVTQSDGTTAAKRSRVVAGSDSGKLYGENSDHIDVPVPTGDQYQRAMYERAVLASIAKLDVSLTTRYRERVRHGDRLDLIDARGPGGR